MEVRMNLTVCFFSDLYKLGKTNNEQNISNSTIWVLT